MPVSAQCSMQLPAPAKKPDIAWCAGAVPCRVGFEHGGGSRDVRRPFSGTVRTGHMNPRCANCVTWERGSCWPSWAGTHRLKTFNSTTRPLMRPQVGSMSRLNPKVGPDYRYARTVTCCSSSSWMKIHKSNSSLPGFPTCGPSFSTCVVTRRCRSVSELTHAIRRPMSLLKSSIDLGASGTARQHLPTR